MEKQGEVVVVSRRDFQTVTIQRRHATTSRRPHCVANRADWCWLVGPDAIWTHIRFDFSVAQAPRVQLAPSAVIRIDRSKVNARRELLLHQKKYVSDDSPR